MKKYMNWAEPSMDGSSYQTSKSTAADRRFYLKLAQMSVSCENGHLLASLTHSTVKHSMSYKA